MPITKSIGSWLTLASDDWTNRLIPLILHSIKRVMDCKFLRASDYKKYLKQRAISCPYCSLNENVPPYLIPEQNRDLTVKIVMGIRFFKSDLEVQIG